MLATRHVRFLPHAVVGVDLGGTTIKAGLVSRDFQILARDAVPTDLRSQRCAAGCDRAGWSSSVTQRHDPARRSASGCPRRSTSATAGCSISTNVPLEDLDFVAEMQRRLGVPVTIDNDANVACLAELRIGAARGRRTW